MKMLLQVVFDLLILQIVLTSSNPCFQDHSSAQCISFIADKRHLNVTEALALRQRALVLYMNENPSTLLLYDENTAVACLASDGQQRPMADSDCIDCGNVKCEHCSCGDRPEVCALYCSRSHSLSGSTQRPTLKSEKKGDGTDRNLDEILIQKNKNIRKLEDVASLLRLTEFKFIFHIWGGVFTVTVLTGILILGIVIHVNKHRRTARSNRTRLAPV